MTWDLINTFGRVLLTFIVVYKITQFRELVNVAERIGLGMMGAGSFLTVSVIWERQRSPFDGWAGCLLTFGAIALLAGRTWRDMKHTRRNKQAAQEAREYLRARGKL